MYLEDIVVSRTGAKFALSCVIGLSVTIPVCLLVSVPVGLLSGIASVTFSSIILCNVYSDDEE